MAETTNISWADATVNYWVGCLEVSNGPHGACQNCYARTWANRFPRYRNTWGAHAERVKITKPLSKARKAVRDAQARGIARPFIFSNSLADIMDNQVPIEWLAEALQVAAATPAAIHLWLTKRPGLFVERIFAAMDLAGLEHMPENIALGMTAVTQAELDRDWPKLAEARAELQPAFIFLSIEPMMGPIDLTRAGAIAWNMGGVDRAGDYHEPEICRVSSVDWVISGGESGHHARITHPAWERALRDQCAVAGVAYHRKQAGEWISTDEALRAGIHLPPGKWVGMGQDGVMTHEPKSSDDTFTRAGKAVTGRMLDGVIHDARPKVAA